MRTIYDVINGDAYQYGVPPDTGLGRGQAQPQFPPDAYAPDRAGPLAWAGLASLRPWMHGGPAPVPGVGSFGYAGASYPAAPNASYPLPPSNGLAGGVPASYIPRHVTVMHYVPNPAYVAQFGAIEPPMPDFMGMLAKRLGVGPAGQGGSPVVEQAPQSPPPRSSNIADPESIRAAPVPTLQALQRQWAMAAIKQPHYGDGSNGHMEETDPVGLVAGITPIPPDSPSGLPATGTNGDASQIAGAAVVPFPERLSKNNCIAYCSDTEALHASGDLQTMPFHVCVNRCLQGIPWTGRPW